MYGAFRASTNRRGGEKDETRLEDGVSRRNYGDRAKEEITQMQILYFAADTGRTLVGKCECTGKLSTEYILVLVKTRGKCDGRNW